MSANKTQPIAIVILAAGNSSRLDRPKQLLFWKGVSLLQNVAEVALESGLGPVLVVTGAYEIASALSVADLPVDLVPNPNWTEGIASGIRCGIEKAQKLVPEVMGATLTPIDQPFVSAAFFKNLAAQQLAGGKGIVATAYAGTKGTPVLFSRSYFSQLQQLTGRQGAKKLLQAFSADVDTVPFAGGECDVDAEEDYERLCESLR